MRQTEQCSGKKSNFGLAAKVGGWSKENVRFEPSRLEKLGCLVCSPKGPGYKRVKWRPSIEGLTGTAEHFPIKRMKVILQTDIMTVEMHLHFSELRYGALRRMKKIVYIHSAFDLTYPVTAIRLPESVSAAEPGPYCVSRSKWLEVTNEAPLILDHFDGRESLPQVELVQSTVFLFPGPDVLADHGSSQATVDTM